MLTRTLGGEELVVFRTASGAAHVTSAYCPHMGAHMGHGGCVEGETLRCPFHGFRFDGRGECVATAYGKRVPPNAKLPVWASREVNGLVIAWLDTEGSAPAWEIPVMDWTGWTPLRTTAFTLRAHVQELAENSVDYGHLAVVHGYREVTAISEAQPRGPVLNARYAMVRPGGWLRGGDVRAEFEVNVHGLGVSIVQTVVPSLGVEFRQFVLATPADRDQVVLRISLSMRAADGAFANRWAKRVPDVVYDKLISPIAMQQYARDVRQDFDIWNYKRYVHPPVLADGDGPIGRYRRWAKQFYPGAAAAQGVAEHAAHDADASS